MVNAALRSNRDIAARQYVRRLTRSSGSSFYWGMRLLPPEKRDAMFEDYIATVKRIQQRSENEKLGSLAQRTLLEETYRPIVRSQEKASKEIVTGLVPIKDEIVNLRQNLGERKRKIRRVG